jgi:hypothetical protein
VTASTSLPRGKVSEMEISYLPGLKTGPNWFLVTVIVKSACALLLGYTESNAMSRTCREKRLSLQLHKESMDQGSQAS